MPTDEPKKPTGHTVADHLYGHDLMHEHEDDSDHDHDWIGDDERLEDNPLWIQDHVTLNTVGIDIGSAGTQVIFSRINLRRLGEDLSSRYYVVSRETLFQSPVALTPYSSEERIDEGKLGAIIDDAYDAAKIHPDDIDTGVVILTGEALRRENSEAIAGVLAEQGGEFVTATAGHHMEAMLAAYGSGAARVSTTKQSASSTSTSAAAPPSSASSRRARCWRLRLSMSAAAFRWSTRTARSSASIRPGSFMPAGQALTGSWAILRARKNWTPSPRKWPMRWSMRSRPGRCRTRSRSFTSPIRSRSSGISTASCSRAALRNMSTTASSATSAIWASGSAGALRRRLESGAFPWPFLAAGECIRATALGASEYSVQLSGNTSFISSPGSLLPRRNLQVLQPPYVCGDAIDPGPAGADDPRAFHRFRHRP